MYSIPKSVLIHSVTLKKVTTGERGRTYGTDTTLTNVLVQPIKQVIKTQSGYEKTYNNTLFYDMTNSSGLTSFDLGDKVIFGTDTYTIKSVQPLYTNTLHHYEVILE